MQQAQRERLARQTCGVSVCGPGSRISILTPRRTIDRFGNRRPVGDTTFTLGWAGGATEEVREEFAVATFVTMSDSEKAAKDLIKKAETSGLKQADIVTGARIYHNQPNIYHLTAEQILDLDRRMTARIEKTKGAAEEKAPKKKAAKKK